MKLKPPSVEPPEGKPLLERWGRAFSAPALRSKSTHSARPLPAAKSSGVKPRLLAEAPRAAAASAGSFCRELRSPEKTQKRPGTCSAVLYSCSFLGGEVAALQRLRTYKHHSPSGAPGHPCPLRPVRLRLGRGDSELRGGGLEGLGASVWSSECARLSAQEWTGLATEDWENSAPACCEMKEAAALA